MLHSLYYAEACNEFVGSISAPLPPGNTAPFEMLQQWRAVGKTMCDLTDPRLEPLTSTGHWPVDQAVMRSSLEWEVKFSPFSKNLITSKTKPRLPIFHSTICLFHKKLLFRKLLMTSLNVVCGLAPQSKILATTMPQNTSVYNLLLDFACE